MCALNALASKGFIDETFIDNEFKLDPTYMGARNAEKAKISMPLYKNKLGAWKKILEDKSIPTSAINAMISGFYIPGQDELLKPFVSIYTEIIEYALKYRNLNEAKNIINGLYPSTIIDSAVIDASDRALLIENLPESIRINILDNKDRTSRAINAREQDNIR